MGKRDRNGSESKTKTREDNWVGHSVHRRINAVHLSRTRTTRNGNEMDAEGCRT